MYSLRWPLRRQILCPTHFKHSEGRWRLFLGAGERAWEGGPCQRSLSSAPLPAASVAAWPDRGAGSAPAFPRQRPPGAPSPPRAPTPPWPAGTNPQGQLVGSQRPRETHRCFPDSKKNTVFIYKFYVFISINDTYLSINHIFNIYISELCPCCWPLHPGWVIKC